jgi:voltage-gated potassium channel
MTHVDDASDGTALRRWEQHAEIPLMIGAFVFLIVYAVPILWPQLPPDSLRWCRWLAWLAWGVFVVDYVARAILAPDRRSYLIRHWADLLVIALPLLRPLRLLRLIALLSVLNRRVATRLRGRIAIYVAGGSLLLAFCAALAELDVERNAPHATIVTFGDAMWWAATTMTTVGYGDTYPVTARGRVIAVVLMIGGIALLGTVTATLASWLVEAVQNEKQEAVDLRAELTALHAKIDTMIDPSGAHTGHHKSRPAD